MTAHTLVAWLLLIWHGFAPQIMQQAVVDTKPASSGGGSISHIADATAGTSSTTPVNSGSTLNVASGDKIIGFCRSGGANNTFTVTDTASDTISYLTHENDANVGNTQIWYIPSATANSSETFTCANNNSAAGDVILVMQFRGGLTSSILDTQLQGSGGATTTVTTGSFSTATAIEVIAMCVVNYTGGTYSAGSIGGAGSTLGPNTISAGSAAWCEWLITSSAQSSITAAINQGASNNNNWGMGAFK